MSLIDDHLLSILKQFDRPGPRYTSYPTAPVFSADYTARRFEDDLIENNRNNSAPVSLYLHIPFCDTLCYFCGCNTIITRNREKISEYLITLKKEIDRTGIVHFEETKRRSDGVGRRDTIISLAGRNLRACKLYSREICIFF